MRVCGHARRRTSRAGAVRTTSPIAENRSTSTLEGASFIAGASLPRGWRTARSPRVRGRRRNRTAARSRPSGPWTLAPIPRGPPRAVLLGIAEERLVERVPADRRGVADHDQLLARPRERDVHAADVGEESEVPLVVRTHERHDHRFLFPPLEAVHGIDFEPLVESRRKQLP